MDAVERIQTIPVRAQRKLIDPAGWFADRSYGAKFGSISFSWP